VQGRTYTPATIQERMRVHGVPAVSVAVINDGRIEWAKAYGLTDVATRRPATTATLFQAASISKPVAAMGALRLVQEGWLALDEDIHTKLRSWKVAANELTARRPVTLRLIMTHSAGLTVHGFPGYAPGVAVPTVVQLLGGEKPANTAAVRVDIEPGSRWRYSGGGTTVMQLLMTDVTGEPFPSLMRRLVLDPIGMTASTYEQPLPTSRAVEAAIGYQSGGAAVAGRYHTYPEMAAAGLWTTPTDLARFVIEVQRSLAGGSNKVLWREMTVAMLTRGVGAHGLGPGIDGAGDSLRFGHGGANEGFRAMFTGFATRGQGAAVMTNSDAGMALVGEIMQAIAREYRWPGFAPRVVVALAMTADAMGEYAGRYVLAGRPLELHIAVADGQLIARQGDGTPFELVRTGTDVFTPLVDAPPFRFERDGAGKITTLVVAGTRLERQP
ncbi:MAG: beta-lactamase family protein, partial [Gemmatimonadota bacterium]|nr:beta-lactamase family protein [Gemmatimonadota bacterium]